ncbi:MAG: tetratricopeptide repeat protein [Brevinema sp.]
MKKISILIIVLLRAAIFAQDTELSTFLVNSFAYSSNNTNFNKGLRLMGIGEYFFNKKIFTKAIPYYQEAYTLISNDSSIPFRLGEIYEHEKLWKLATLYYEDSIKLSAQSENFAKSQLVTYIAHIRIAKIAYKANNREKALQLVSFLRDEQSIMKSLYPTAWDEFTNFFDPLLPDTATRTVLSNKSNQ